MAILLFLIIFSILITVNARSVNLTDHEILLTTKSSFRPYQERESRALENNSTSLDHNENPTTTTEIPANFDWREKKAVTRVKNQELCDNSDWAFSALGALEAQLFLKTKTLTELSEQELIDCSKQNGNYGCSGGDPRKAFHYIEGNGIQTEKSYPYRGNELKNCQKELGGNTIAKNSTIILTKIPQGNEAGMKTLVHSKGPILALIDVSRDSFRFYKEGIYDDENCAEVGNHNVLIVGYGETDESEKFWIVKNSWGKDWGENGYIKVARNKNTCGIASNATYIEIV